MPFSGEQKRLFDRCYAKAISMDESEATNLVVIMYHMIDLLKKSQQSFLVRVPPKEMGVHPMNRNGKRINGGTMHKKGRTIHSVGFTTKLCGPDKAIAFENNPMTNNCETWTLGLTDTVEFANYTAGTVRGGSVGCSHLNQWLAAVGGGAETPFPELLCEPGRKQMSMHRVTDGNDELRAAVEQGLEWTLIKWQVEVEYPELPSIIQRGLNIEHHVAEGESWDEQLLLTAKKAQASAKSNHKTKQIDWHWVQRTVAASSPPRLLDVPAHIKFCQKWGGGEDQVLVMETVAYLEAAMPSGRIVNGNFLEKLARLKIAPSDLIPHTIHACVIANAVGNKAHENVGCTVTDVHVRSLVGENKVKGLKANEMIRKAREVTQAMPNTDGNKRERTLLLGGFMFEIVKFIFNLESEYATMEKISEDFVGRLCHTAPAAQGSTPQEAVVPNFVGFVDGSSDAGKITLHNAGFRVGDIVHRKSDTEDDQHAIQYINDDGSVGVNQVSADGSISTASVVVITLDEFVHQYKTCKWRSELMDGYPGNAIAATEQFSDMLSQAAVAFALDVLDKTGGYAKVDLRCMKKPNQRLICLADLEPRQMRLVPLTTKIVRPTSCAQPSNVDVLVGDVAFQLQRILDKTCISEYWMMRSTPDREKGEYGG